MERIIFEEPDFDNWGLGKSVKYLDKEREYLLEWDKYFKDEYIDNIRNYGLKPMLNEYLSKFYGKEVNAFPNHRQDMIHLTNLTGNEDGLRYVVGCLLTVRDQESMLEAIGRQLFAGVINDYNLRKEKEAAELEFKKKRCYLI